MILHLLKKFICRVYKSHFLKAVFTLGIGDILSQGILSLSAPILTRIYNPEDFSIFAFFSSIIAVVVPGVCGKMEIAIISVRGSLKSIRTFELSIFISILFSLFVFIILLLFSEHIIYFFHLEKIRNLIIFIPFVLFAMATTISLQYFANRRSEYKVISFSKLIISSFSVFVSIVSGLFNVEYGLIWGLIIGNLSGFIWMARRYSYLFSLKILNICKEKIYIIKEFRGLLIFNAPTSFLNSALFHLPIFFLSLNYSVEIVGYYSLLSRVAVYPLIFISDAFSRVHLKKITVLLHENKDLEKYFYKSSLFLFFIIFPFSVFMILYSPIVFRLIFGSAWIASGEFLQILMPSFAVRFIVSTLSTTFGATGRHGLAAFWKLLSFCVTSSVFYFFSPRVSINDMFYLYCFVDVVLYFIYYIFAWMAAKWPAYQIKTP